MAKIAGLLLLSLVLLAGEGAIAQPTRLSAAEVTTRSQGLPDWTVDGQQLSCTYQFEGFVEAIAFVNALVEPSETLGHHPDLTVTYNRVAIALTTHDAGGLSDLDFVLAQQISQVAAPQSCIP